MPLFDRRPWSFLLLILLLGYGSASAEPGVPEPQSALSGAELVAALQSGGYVIYFRHADTGPAYPESGPIDLERCETQRNLNDKGREEAGAIGAAFRRLQIPVGEVLSSQFCRCWQSADLAFGRHVKTPTLTGVARGAEAQTRRQQASAGLRKLLSTPPAAGINTVLVSHGFNLMDLEGFHLHTQGEAAIYRPVPDGYRLVARLLPAQWAQLP